MPLRTKLTLTLLVTSLFAAATVGGVAYWMIMRDFRANVMSAAFAHFREDVVAYEAAFGQLDETRNPVPFSRFVMQRRGRMPPPLDGLPPPGPIERRAPPFRFLLIDPQGRIVKGIGDQERNTPADAATLASALPIEVDGRLIALASPIGEPALSESDRSYLAAMEKALLTGIVAAAALAVALGLLVSRRMSQSLSEMADAIRRMQADRERACPVPVRSRDEIGAQAQAFNDMNAELAQAHRELRESAEFTARQSEQLKELSIRDPLTDLFNRRHFDAQAERLYAQARRYHHPLTVMVGDLDFFKQINDGFSHAVGDEVLRVIATLLREGTRQSDLVARYGGEEFVVLFPESSLAQAAQCCEKLRQRIEDYPWQDVHPGVAVTMSMGLCDRIEAGSVEKMLIEADDLLYQAKHGGRNRVLPAVGIAA